MKKTPFYRRTFVVNWSLQVRYAVLLAVFTALFSMVMGFFALRADPGVVESSEDRFRMVMVVSWGIGLTAVAATFGLVLSNRWAGPLFRMERYLRQMAEGQLPVISPPRKGDELHDLFATFRAASESLRNRQERELQALEGSLKLLERAEGAAALDALAGLRELAEQKKALLGPQAIDAPGT